MQNKIFISYRREDSGANALGISQYLEREFGRKSVFIDVDMRAGAKFPAVLEERLSECKVMLVLIGPDWLNAKDDEGNHRLDNPHDWVRLEIAHALRRNITVIPVRVNGAPLPTRSSLPDEIRSLLDHQAISVSLAGFRHEMVSLVRDIRAIAVRRPWRRFGIIAAGVIPLVALVALGQAVGFRDVIERIRTLVTARTNPVELWTSKPGEWVMYATDNNPIAYYINPHSVATFGGRVVFAGRFLLKRANASESPDAMTSQNAYEEDVTVLDCKASLWAWSERTLYDKNGKSTFHFKWGEPESLDLSIGGKVAQGTVISLAQRILCDEQMRSQLIAARQASEKNFSYLSSTINGDGDIFYGLPKATLNSPYQIELPVLVKLHDEHSFAELFPGQYVLGLPATGYRAFVQYLQLNCAARKIQTSSIERFDTAGYLLNFVALIPFQEIDVKANPFVALLKAGCAGSAPLVAGVYKGSIQGNYGTKGNIDEIISIIVAQAGGVVNVTFQTAGAGEGKGTGTLSNDGTVASMPVQSTAPNCPGSYAASLKFDADALTWSYNGQDCSGPIKGHGTAKRMDD
ncbi:MAG: toll/interleukin-1 receptor domain-containing protein [Methylovirgula sp.]|jgi:hypothetical protein